VKQSVVSVLLVEDDEDDYVLTRALLADGFGNRFTVDWESSPEAALQKLTTGSYDVALVDHHLGSTNGIELLRTAMSRGCRLPVVMLTGQDDRATDLDAMYAGASDYLVKSRVNGEMLERAIRYARERYRLLEEIRTLSLRDELTGLGNRRAFFTQAEQRIRVLERAQALFVLVYADLDGLKTANDTLGHEVGDLLLMDAARVLSTTFRTTDLIARLGGDEFVALAEASAEDDDVRVLQRIEHQITIRNAKALPGAPLLSMSTGAFCFRTSPSVTLKELVADADARMLLQKSKRKRELQRAA
jgi:diguanylate cyclase (GGDEF)-like protein